MIAFIGMPGPMEMMILLIVGAVVIGLPILLLVVSLTAKGRPAAAQAGPECPACGGWTVPQASYCQWCGKALGTGQGG